MLANHYRSPTSQTCHQHIWSPTSVTNIDVTKKVGRLVEIVGQIIDVIRLSIKMSVENNEINTVLKVQVNRTSILGFQKPLLHH